MTVGIRPASHIITTQYRNWHIVHNKSILLIGNGPSTKELVEYGFDSIPEHIDTFGMGLSYKFYGKINWWPTYYVCADQNVVKNHEAHLRSVVLDEGVGVKRFFFPIELANTDRLEVIPHNSTGDFAFRKAIELGYEQIFIIGIDLDYKPLNEATRLTRSEFDELGVKMDYDTNAIYRIRRPVHDNPNYFFPDYQDVGDIYSEPRGRSWHLLNWQRALEFSQERQIPVRNLGSTSKLDLFHKVSLGEAFAATEKFRATVPDIRVSQIASEIFRTEKALSDSVLRLYAEEKQRREALENRLARSADPSTDSSSLDRSLAHIATAFSTGVDDVGGDELAISVIVPCFNSASFIEPCLESLARQTLNQDRFEVICVDDCSTDNTVAEIERYRPRIKNLTVIRQTRNQKQGAARNKGMDVARGPFIVFIDSDDFFRLDALEQLLNGTKGGADVVVGQLVRVRYDKPYNPKSLDRRLVGDTASSVLTNSIGWGPVCTLISRDLIVDHAIRFEEDMYFEDIPFCVDLFLACRQCEVLKDQLYYYVQRDTSTVNSLNEVKLSDSARAMSVVFSKISTDSGAVETFAQTAIRWLRLQSVRVRDSAATPAEKQRLSDHLRAELNHFGVDRLIGEDAVLEIASMMLRRPAPPAVDGSVDGPTCAHPWKAGLEADFAGHVIFYCEVDYHIRSAAPVARALVRQGIHSIIVDASRSTSFTTNRPMSDTELAEYADLDIRAFNVAKALPFSIEASAFVFMNDLTYTKQLIMENFGFGVPTFGFYEGINDDWNLDRVAPRRPYRSLDYLLLPGIYQQGFYADRECRIVGLPNVRSRLAKPYTRPRTSRAVINVNFTYGVLEDRRDTFVQSAVEACTQLGLDYVITQHPADKADLSRYNVAKASVYDLLDEGTILISRFSTTILEALAMGRPVVYHNPIDEKVPKFHQPLGAFRCTHSVAQLKAALSHELKFLEAGGDVRERAALFLHFHCNTQSSEPPAELAARAIADVLSVPIERLAFKTGKIRRLVQPLVSKNGDDASNMVALDSASAIALIGELLLNPVGTLPKLQRGQPLYATAQLLLSQNHPLSEHFVRVREWAYATKSNE